MPLFVGKYWHQSGFRPLDHLVLGVCMRLVFCALSIVDQGLGRSFIETLEAPKVDIYEECACLGEIKRCRFEERLIVFQMR